MAEVKQEIPERWKNKHKFYSNLSSTQSQIIVSAIEDVAALEAVRKERLKKLIELHTIYCNDVCERCPEHTDECKEFSGYIARARALDKEG